MIRTAIVEDDSLYREELQELLQLLEMYGR